MEIELSVIIPVYNAEKTIRKCLGSLAGQLDDRIEVICVDDGSRDNSYNICQEYAESNRSIHVYHQGNKGVSAARNYGIQLASGKYIAFVDSDDMVTSDYIGKLMPHLGKADLLQFQYEKADEYGNRTYVSVMEEGLYTDLNKLYDVISSSAEGIFASWNKIYRRNILIQKGLFFPDGVAAGEDMRFILEYVNCMDSTFVLPDALYTYCYNSTSATHSPELVSICNCLNNYKILKSFISEHCVTPDYNKTRIVTFNLLYELIVLIKRDKKANNKQISKILPSDFIEELTSTIANSVTQKFRQFLLKNRLYQIMLIIDTCKNYRK